MSMLLLAAMMMAQAPAAVEPAPTRPAVQPAVKEKPKKVCQYIEITGSRSRQRVCRDENGTLDLGPGVSDTGWGKTRVNDPAVAVGPPGA